MTMFSFIVDLCESRLIPSRGSLKNWRTETLAELCYLYFLSLCILLHNDSTHSWAKQYCHAAADAPDFASWRSNGNDLYVMLHVLSTADDVGLPTARLRRWLRNPMHDTQEILVRLDGLLHVRQADQKAVRRIVAHWDDTDHDVRTSAIRKLVQWIQQKSHSNSEVLPHLKRLISVEESATAGATSAANVATCAGGLGAGFDPNGDHGVYQKKQRKPRLIRRTESPE